MGRKICLKNKIIKTRNSFSFEVQLNCPFDEINWPVSKVYLNGTEIQWPRFVDNIFLFEKSDLPNGKYSYLFKIFDHQQQLMDELFIPIWIGKEWSWANGVMYQIMTDRFVNGDPSLDAPIDGVPFKSNWQGGDFRGIINKINDGYFKDLGADIICISSPIINTSAMGRGIDDDYQYSAYHSYWPIAFGHTDERPTPFLKTPIEPHFGSKAELIELVNCAHKNGIRVVMDFVANQIHADSPMFPRVPERWFTPVHICDWEKPLSCWFTDYLPDLDYGVEEVLQLAMDHALWLIQTFNFDGFRVDAVKHMDMEFTIRLKKNIREKIEHTGVPFYMVGETFSGDLEFDLISNYIGDDLLNGQFDFPLFYHLIRTFIIEQEDFKTFFQFLKENERRYQKKCSLSAIMTNFLGTHDVPRVASLANNDFGFENGELGGVVAKARSWENSPVVSSEERTYQKLKQAWVVLMSLPGIPLVYQGDEIGMPGAADPDNRRMMIFDDELNHLQKDLKEFVSKIILLRKKHSAFRHGAINDLLISNDILVYSVGDTNDYAVVVINKGKETATINFELDRLIHSNLSGMLTAKKYEIVNSSIQMTIPPFFVDILC